MNNNKNKPCSFVCLFVFSFDIIFFSPFPCFHTLSFSGLDLICVCSVSWQQADTITSGTGHSLVASLLQSMSAVSIACLVVQIVYNKVASNLVLMPVLVVNTITGSPFCKPGNVGFGGCSKVCHFNCQFLSDVHFNFFSVCLFSFLPFSHLVLFLFRIPSVAQHALLSLRTSLQSCHFFKIHCRLCSLQRNQCQSWTSQLFVKQVGLWLLNWLCLSAD